MTAVPVVVFHAIRDDGDPWSMSWSRFREYAGMVADSGRTAVTVHELAQRLRTGASVAGLVAVSFDDGDASQLPAAAALADAGLASTVYVTVGYLGTDGMLDAAQLPELSAVPGVEVGSHSVQHVHLDVLGPAELRAQLRDSRAALEDLVGQEVRGIAYPHGSHDRRVLRAAEQAGYRSGAAVRNALSHDREHPLSVSRLIVTQATPIPMVQAFLRGEGRLGETRPRLRTRGFRLYRKARHRLTSA
ncbi:MAG: polysaccharide deacetylase family protein [Mycobacteriales bacterium]